VTATHGPDEDRGELPDGVDNLAHGDLPATAGLRDLQPDHTPALVHAVPREREEFTLAQPRLQRHRHDGREVPRPTCATGIEEPRFFVGLQPPDTPLRFLLHPDLRDGGQHLPFLVREAQQVAEDRQGSIDARRRESRRLTVLVLPTDRQGSQACPP